MTSPRASLLATHSLLQAIPTRPAVPTGPPPAGEHNGKRFRPKTVELSPGSTSWRHGDHAHYARASGRGVLRSDGSTTCAPVEFGEGHPGLTHAPPSSPPARSGPCRTGQRRAIVRAPREARPTPRAGGHGARTKGRRNVLWTSFCVPEPRHVAGAALPRGCGRLLWARPDGPMRGVPRRGGGSRFALVG